MFLLIYGLINAFTQQQNNSKSVAADAMNTSADDFANQEDGGGVDAPVLVECILPET